MVGEEVVRCHRPRICGNVVNLDVKIGTDSAARNAIDLAVEVSTGMEVCKDGIGWQANVIGVADRVVPPKCSCGVEILVFATKQIDIGAVGCTAEPTTRLRQWRARRGSRRWRGCCGVDTVHAIRVLVSSRYGRCARRDCHGANQESPDCSDTYSYGPVFHWSTAKPVQVRRYARDGFLANGVDRFLDFS